MKNDNLILQLFMDSVKGRLGDGYEVTVRDVIKNNDEKLCGLTIREYGSNISPTIYLDALLEAYREGLPLDCCVDKIIQTYEKNKVTGPVDLSGIWEFSSVKDRIYFSLVNTERNKGRLKDIPHLQFKDLSIIFKVLISSSKSGTASITIYSDILKIWELTEQRLFELALENTQRLFPSEIIHICDVISSLGVPIPANDSIPMYILTNKKRYDGAGGMLYPQVLKDFSDKIGDSFYILPSSIHEVILLPQKFCGSAKTLMNMVREVNTEHVERDEILSDNVYYYSRETDSITQII